MERLPSIWQSGFLAERAAQGLEKMNERIAGDGLVLSAPEIQALALRHGQVLQNTGRVEFGESILPKLVFTFCDSPYIPPGDFAATIGELMECFYHFKNETREAVGDDDLLAYMKRHFDGICHGSMEYLCGTVLEGLAEAIRQGRAWDQTDDELEETEETDG